jgi:hypothetical protein
MPGFQIDQADDGQSLKIDKDIKRAHRWRIVKFGPTLETNQMLFAKSVTMPDIGFEEANVLGSSIAYKFAVKPEFGDVVVAFYDVEALEPKIREWQSKVWSAKNGIGKADDYKDLVELYLTDGTGEPVDNSWAFVNAWPKIVNHGELLYDSSEFKLVTVTISYDWIEYPPVAAINKAGKEISRAVSESLSGIQSTLSGLFS